jgi:hypothetical protein
VYSVIVLLLTGFLFYVLFPHSDCDRLAQLSAEEVKAAVDCAAKYADGVDPATGKACNQATVKLCQEDSFSIFGGPQFVRAYLGLMWPEYMLYYKQFPSAQIKSGFSGFSESYPFERAYHGQRFYDFRPTLTQFKAFFKGKYLETACTSEPGLCFDTRGRQEVVKVDVPPEIKDVRLFRLPTGMAQTNPRFYLAAPCYAKVTFKQQRDPATGKVILAYVDKKSSLGSNYCYTNEAAIAGLMTAYDAEMGCQVGLLLADFFTGGSRRAAKEGGQQTANVFLREGAEVEAKETVSIAIEKSFSRAFAREAGTGAARASETVSLDVGKTMFTQVAVRDLKRETVETTTGFAIDRSTIQIEKRTGVALSNEALAASRDKVISQAYAKGAGTTLRQTMKGASIDAMEGSITRPFLKKAPLESLGGSTRGVLENAARQGIRQNPALEGASKEAEDAAVKRVVDDVITQGKLPIEDAIGQTARRGAGELGADIGKPLSQIELRQTETIISERSVEIAARPLAEEVVTDQLVDETVDMTVNDLAKNVASRGLSKAGIAEVMARSAAKRAWNMEGMPTADIQQVSYMFGVLGVPCVDVDPCRGAFSCAETMLWPGLPFIELTPDRMKGDARSANTAAEVFYQCCNDFNYGAEKDPKAITCDDPSELVDLIKPELNLNKTDNVTLSMLAGYIGLPDEKVPAACGLAKGNNSKICQDALEVRKINLPADRCWGPEGQEISQHTFDFDTIRSSANITGFARLFTESCDSHITVEVGNETDKLVTVSKQDGNLFPDSTEFNIAGPLTFRYLRISEDSGCFLDGSAVVLDPVIDRITRAEVSTTYALPAQTYSYFIVPEGYTSKASSLCTQVPSCGVVSKFNTEAQAWVRYSYDPDAGVAGEDFQMVGGDKIGILPNEDSHVIFSVGP